MNSASLIENQHNDIALNIRIYFRISGFSILISIQREQDAMTIEHDQNSHLFCCQRELIRWQLFQEMEPEEIIKAWNVTYHNREAPSIQTIYKLRRLYQKGESSKPKKVGPKSRSVLNDKKLKEIEEEISKKKFITNEALSNQVNLPESTLRDGLKALNMKK